MTLSTPNPNPNPQPQPPNLNPNPEPKPKPTPHTKVCDEALKEIGMQMIESRDCALDPNPGGEPWWVILTPSLFSLFRLQFTTVGYYFMNIVLTFMEMIRLAPKGSGKVRALPQGAQFILTIGLLPLTRLPFYLRPGARDAPPRPGGFDARRRRRNLHAHVPRPREQAEQARAARAGVKQGEGLCGGGATLTGGL